MAKETSMNRHRAMLFSHLKDTDVIPPKSSRSPVHCDMGRRKEADIPGDLRARVQILASTCPRLQSRRVTPPKLDVMRSKKAVVRELRA